MHNGLAQRVAQNYVRLYRSVGFESAMEYVSRLALTDLDKQQVKQQVTKIMEKPDDHSKTPT